MTKQLLFSVTAADCLWNYERGTGAGGQKRNKTESKVRCTHFASGAVGVSDETRSQHQNKRLAFVAMLATPAFKAWHQREVSRRLGDELAVERAVELAMHPKNLRLEVKDDGKWVTWVEPKLCQSCQDARDPMCIDDAGPCLGGDCPGVALAQERIRSATGL